MSKPDPVTPDLARSWLALAEAASPGPLSYDSGITDDSTDPPDQGKCAAVYDRAGNWLADLDTDMAVEFKDANGRLFAVSREAVPALAREVLAAHEALDAESLNPGPLGDRIALLRADRKRLAEALTVREWPDTDAKWRLHTESVAPLLVDLVASASSQHGGMFTVRNEKKDGAPLTPSQEGAVEVFLEFGPKVMLELLKEREADQLRLAEHARLHTELNNILHPKGDGPKAPSLCDLVSYVRGDLAKRDAELDAFRKSRDGAIRVRAPADPVDPVPTPEELGATTEPYRLIGIYPEGDYSTFSCLDPEWARRYMAARNGRLVVAVAEVPTGTEEYLRAARAGITLRPVAAGDVDSYLGPKAGAEAEELCQRIQALQSECVPGDPWFMRLQTVLDTNARDSLRWLEERDADKECIATLKGAVAEAAALRSGLEAQLRQRVPGTPSHTCLQGLLNRAGPQSKRWLEERDGLVGEVEKLRASLVAVEASPSQGDPLAVLDALAAQLHGTVESLADADGHFVTLHYNLAGEPERARGTGATRAEAAAKCLAVCPRPSPVAPVPTLSRAHFFAWRDVGAIERTKGNARPDREGPEGDAMREGWDDEDRRQARAAKPSLTALCDAALTHPNPLSTAEGERLMALGWGVAEVVAMEPELARERIRLRATPDRDLIRDEDGKPVTSRQAGRNARRWGHPREAEFSLHEAEWLAGWDAEDARTALAEDAAHTPACDAQSAAEGAGGTDCICEDDGAPDPAGETGGASSTLHRCMRGCGRTWIAPSHCGDCDCGTEPVRAGGAS